MGAFLQGRKKEKKKKRKSGWARLQQGEVLGDVLLALALVRLPTARGVLEQQCEVTVRSAVAALRCEGGSVSRSGARHCERGF